MPCPTCGAEDVTPLTLTEFDNLAGAAKVCEECRTVFLVVDEARLSAALLDRQIAGWDAVRAVLCETLDARQTAVSVSLREKNPRATG